MNILFIKHFFVGVMVSEISRVSVFGYRPYSFTFPYTSKLTYVTTKQVHAYMPRSILNII